MNFQYTQCKPLRCCLYALAAAVLLQGFLLAAPNAEAARTPTHKEQSGKLPKSGSVILRSGMEWMDESSALFNELKATMQPLLEARGLTVQEAGPSTLLPMPAEGAPASAKSRRAAVPDDNLFTRSQIEGNPIMQRGGRIPGHLPKEILSQDAQAADYVIVCRFASVTPGRLSRLLTPSLLLMASSGGYSASHQDDQGTPVMLAASGLVKGVGTMGYGTPATPAPPSSGYGSTPGDYLRGYEGNSPEPGDIWNREADLRARDYMFKHGPQPQYATPPATVGGPSLPERPVTPTLPKPPLPGDTDMPAGSPGPAAPRAPQVPGAQSAAPQSGFPVAGYALELECYDLKAMQGSKKPSPIWRCTVHQRADAANLATALPDMIRLALGVKGK